MLKNAEYNENKPCIQLEAAFSSISITLSEDPIRMKPIGQVYGEMGIEGKQKYKLHLLCLYISRNTLLSTCDISK